MQKCQATCPLCHAEAEFKDFDYGDKKVFDCKVCTKYIISKKAESLLDNFNGTTIRMRYSNIAKNLDETCILNLRTYNNELRQVVIRPEVIYFK